jgi:cytochrome b561
MQLRDSAERYGAMSQALHWITVLLVIVAWALGEFDDIFPKGPARAAGLYAHITAGSGVIVILGLRLLWRAGNPSPPAEPTVLGAWLDHVAQLAQLALYALLIAAPVTGIVLQFARGDALPLFGLWEIASPWAADRAFARTVKGLHELLANALVILAGIHAAAALIHHWVLGDRTLARMLPGARL